MNIRIFLEFFFLELVLICNVAKCVTNFFRIFLFYDIDDIYRVSCQNPTTFASNKKICDRTIFKNLIKKKINHKIFERIIFEYSNKRSKIFIIRILKI
jgi:hypothetical protein